MRAKITNGQINQSKMATPPTNTIDKQAIDPAISSINRKTTPTRRIMVFIKIVSSKADIPDLGTYSSPRRLHGENKVTINK